MRIKHTTIKLKTQAFCQFVDLTDRVQAFIGKAKIRNGHVVIYSKHTTMAIRINERENGFTQDFRDFMLRLFPKQAYYRHNDLSIRTENLVCDPGATDCLNGHSHCAHLLLSTSETVPVIDGKLMLGRWQRVFAIELDVARSREVFLQAVGQ